MLCVCVCVCVCELTQRRITDGVTLCVSGLSLSICGCGCGVPGRTAIEDEDAAGGAIHIDAYLDFCESALLSARATDGRSAGGSQRGGSLFIDYRLQRPTHARVCLILALGYM